MLKGYVTQGSLEKHKRYNVTLIENLLGGLYYVLLNNDCHNNGKDRNQCLFSSQTMVMTLVGGHDVQSR